jgi:hypothetical protein
MIGWSYGAKVGGMIHGAILISSTYEHEEDKGQQVCSALTLTFMQKLMISLMPWMIND